MNLTTRYDMRDGFLTASFCGGETHVPINQKICPEFRVLPRYPDIPAELGFVFKSPAGGVITYSINVATENFNLAFAEISKGSGACHRTKLAEHGFPISTLQGSWEAFLHCLMFPVSYNSTILTAKENTHE